LRAPLTKNLVTILTHMQAFGSPLRQVFLHRHITTLLGYRTKINTRFLAKPHPIAYGGKP